VDLRTTEENIAENVTPLKSFLGEEKKMDFHGEYFRRRGALG